MSLLPYNRTHISRYPTFNIWGSVREHQVIMFESTYTAFTHYKCKKLRGQIEIEHASEISITLLKLVWIRAVIICILCLEWWMVWGVSSAQHTSFSGTLKVCTYPHPVYPLCLWTTSQESVRLSDGLSVWECVGMTTWFTLSKKTVQIRKHFLLTHWAEAEVLIEVWIVGEEPLMLMRILFGCHWLKCFPKATIFMG